MFTQIYQLLATLWKTRRTTAVMYPSALVASLRLQLLVPSPQVHQDPTLCQLFSTLSSKEVDTPVTSVGSTKESWWAGYLEQLHVWHDKKVLKLHQQLGQCLFQQDVQQDSMVSATTQTKAVVICCVWPDEKHAANTNATIHFARALKGIKAGSGVTSRVQTLPPATEVERLRAEVVCLRDKIKDLERQLCEARVQRLVEEEEHHQQDSERLSRKVVTEADGALVQIWPSLYVLLAKL